jgi:GNAT superfamily N-acetyltransferase
MTSLRYELRPSDVEAVRALVASTGFFSQPEVQIAGELLVDRLREGDASGHFFVMAEEEGELLGYACFGPIDATKSSWDLYWIAVRQARRGGGVGKQVLAEVEQEIRKRGGTRLYIDTASRAQYAPTHAFYERAGYERAAFLPDYYAPGDGRITFAKAF